MLLETIWSRSYKIYCTLSYLNVTRPGNKCISESCHCHLVCISNIYTWLLLEGSTVGPLTKTLDVWVDVYINFESHGCTSMTSYSGCFFCTVDQVINGCTWLPLTTHIWCRIGCLESKRNKSRDKMSQCGFPKELQWVLDILQKCLGLMLRKIWKHLPNWIETVIYPRLLFLMKTS